MLFRSKSQTENEQAHIASALVFELSKVGLAHVRNRVMGQLRNIDESLAKRVAQGLGAELPAAVKPFKPALDLPPSDALSIQKNWNATLQGRKVGLLFSEGSNKAEIDKLIAAIEAEGGSVFKVAPKIGPLKLDSGEMQADGQLAGSPSVLFDAIAMILAPAEAQKLALNAAALEFVADAFGHLKAIGHCDGSKVILARARIEADAGVTHYNDLPETAKRRYWAREPNVRDLA